MELSITKNNLAAAIATPVTDLDQLFTRVEPFLPAAKRTLEKSIDYQIADIDASLAPLVQEFVCLQAFWQSLQQIDLIWTPSGFGVVSNNTLAPASKERVENLRNNTLRRAIEAKYNLLDELFATTAYVNAITPDSFILLWSQYKQLAGEQIDAQEFDTYRYKFRSTEWKLARLMSKAELDNLRNLAARQWLADWQATVAQKEVIEQVELFVIGRVADITTADECLPRIMSIINDPNNAADFPLYVNSSEYIANNSAPYENAADKPTYFFC